MAMHPDPGSISTASHLKRELLFAALGLVLGFVLLPFLIYLIGQLIIGPYSGGTQGFGSFYGDLVRDLALPKPNSWFIVVGPYLMLLGLRLIFFRSSASPTDAPSNSPRKSTPRRQRKEPTLGL